MDNLKLSRLIISITIVLTLTLALLTNLFSLLNHSDFQHFGERLGYELLVKLSIFLLLTYIITIYYYRSLINVYNKSNGLSNEKELTDKEINKIRKNILENLSRDEKIFLKQFIETDTRTLKFSIHNETAMALRNQDVLAITSPIATGNDLRMAFTIHPWAFEYLKKKPYLLK